MTVTLQSRMFALGHGKPVDIGSSKRTSNQWPSSDEKYELSDLLVQVFNTSERNATPFEFSHILYFWPNSAQSIFGNMNHCGAVGDCSEHSSLCKKSYSRAAEKYQSPPLIFLHIYFCLFLNLLHKVSCSCSNLKILPCTHPTQVINN